MTGPHGIVIRCRNRTKDAAVEGWRGECAKCGAANGEDCRQPLGEQAGTPKGGKAS